MAVHKIKTTLDTTVIAGKAHDSWIVTRNGVIDTLDIGINAGGAFKGRSFEIDGRVYGLEFGMVLGNANGKGGSTVEIGAKGLVASDGIGMLSQGDGQTVVNHGNISASEGILSFGQRATFINHGRIEVEDGGIVIETGSARIVNNGTIYGEGNIFAKDGAGRVVVVNNGSIEGDGKVGIEMQGDAFHRIVNAGHVDGDIFGGNGRDVFVNRKGAASGQIDMGDGNDLYVIDTGGLALYESTYNGRDTVRASVSYTLGDNFEVLRLTGKRMIDGRGNELDNRITGNGSANKLNGRDGDDILTGAGGKDTFIFNYLGGKDEITDFKGGVDRIDLRDFSGHGIEDFADVRAAARNQNGDLLITIGTDEILIHDFSKKELDSSDFIL